MERILEPEVMDGEAQSEAYALADFDEVNQGFAERFLQTFPALSNGRILDLGCGPADISLRICRERPGLHLTAVDASEPMLRFARQAVEAAGLEDRVQLTQGYIPGALEEDARFDGCFSNSLLHHLPDPSVLWAEIPKHLRPGGALLVTDLLRPQSSEEVTQIVREYSEGEPEILQQDFYHSLHAAFRVDEVRDQIAQAGLQGLEVRQISDRHLEVSGHIA